MTRWQAPVGIHGYGGYVPTGRLSREEVAEANAWANGSLRSLARSERSGAGWDEDSITMAVEAARDCLGDEVRSQVGDLYFATTTAPFEDRLNGGVIAGALKLRDSVASHESTGSLRAGTSALLCACDAMAARGGTALCLSRFGA